MDFGKVMYPLLYLKWTTNEYLLYITWNPVQCYVPAWMGGGVWGRMDSCICTAESLHCSPETITILLTGYARVQNVFGVIKKKNTIKKVKRQHTSLYWLYIKNPYNSVKTQIAQLKNGQKTWTDISLKKKNKWPTSTLKMFNIISHQENANQRTPLQNHQDG